MKLENAHKKYCFLIMVGDGDSYHGLPVHLRTRLKNKLHRSIYLELAYYKDGNGVVKRCHYYDRKIQAAGNSDYAADVDKLFLPVQL